MGKFQELLQRKKNKHADYRSTFESKSGARVLKDIIQFSGVLTSSFKKDPYETAFAEGQRNVCLKILHELNITPEEFQAMAAKAKQLESDW